MIYEKKLSEFKQLITNIEYFKNALNSLIYWDKITYMPVKGIEYRSKTMAFLADQQYQMMSSDKFESYVKYFDGNKRNDVVTNAMIRNIKASLEYVKNIPEEEYSSYIKLIAVAEQVWEKSRENNDFGEFEEYLELIVDFFKSFAEHWGYEENPYDALLGYYVEGLTVSKTDKTMEEIKAAICPMIETIKNSEIKHKKIDITNIDENKQEEIWKMILGEMGFDFNAGRVDIGAHPTVLANSSSDVRIVNSYNKKDLMAGIFNILHSCGKGIYQQSISKELGGTFMAEVPSFALEEAIGRFYENIIGKSKGFWKYFLPKIKAIAPELGNITEEDIFESINNVAPSLIRIEADELTYLLHIIIRYEIEKELINNKLKVKELPKKWNEKYNNYLGIAPLDDATGALQDIHWAAGYFGYFPSYCVSNLIGSQLAAYFEKEEGSLEEMVEKGDFNTIKRWLTDRIFKFGAVYDTYDLIEMATGEKLNSTYYIDYLRKKFSEVYKFNI